MKKRKIEHCLDQGVAPSPPLQEHLDSCASCRGFYQRRRRLIETLGAGALEQQVEPPPFLHGKIMAAIARAPDVETVPSPAFRPRWGLAVVGTALLLLVGTVAVKYLKPAAPSGGIDYVKVIELSGDELLETTTGRTLEKWSQALNEPLDAELQLVMSDARKAIDSLTENFIPARLRAYGSLPAP